MLPSIAPLTGDKGLSTADVTQKNGNKVLVRSHRMPRAQSGEFRDPDADPNQLLTHGAKGGSGTSLFNPNNQAPDGRFYIPFPPRGDGFDMSQFGVTKTTDAVGPIDKSAAAQGASRGRLPTLAGAFGRVIVVGKESGNGLSFAERLNELSNLSRGLNRRFSETAAITHFLERCEALVVYMKKDRYQVKFSEIQRYSQLRGVVGGIALYNRRAAGVGTQLEALQASVTKRFSTAARSDPRWKAQTIG